MDFSLPNTNDHYDRGTYKPYFAPASIHTIMEESHEDTIYT